MNKILAFALVLSGLQTSAQIFELGLRGGANLHGVQVKEFDGDQTIEDIESGDRKVGFHAGVYGRFKLTTFFIQPELLYTNVSGEVQTQNADGSSQDLDLNFSRFDIPIMAGFALGPVRLGVGPVASFAISEPGDAFDNSFNQASFGYQAGIGLDLGKLSIDVRYEGPFSKTAETITIGGTDYQTDTRTNQIMIGLGFQLL
ncbi:MAG: porin family protein [Owenweeksia sp.]